MYNKLFTKILDSSIWMESSDTRVVWLTLIAAMDEDGFAQFAGLANLAHRAIVSMEAATDAIKSLESPDPDSSDPDHDGRRIERVPGGWMVLNATKYREMVTRIAGREMTRVRVARHRAKRNGDVTAGNASVTDGNGDVTVDQKCNDRVMQSEAYTEADSNTEEILPSRKARKARKKSSEMTTPKDTWITPWLNAFSDAHQVVYEMPYSITGADVKQLSVLTKRKDGNEQPVLTMERWIVAVQNFFSSPRDQHTMRELCSKFAGFHRSAINEFNKPVIGPVSVNGVQTKRETENERNRRECNQLIASLERSAASSGNETLEGIAGNSRSTGDDERRRPGLDGKLLEPRTS